jgi:hypothetical protein
LITPCRFRYRRQTNIFKAEISQKSHDWSLVRIAVRTIATSPALIAAGSCAQNWATIANPDQPRMMVILFA